MICRNHFLALALAALSCLPWSASAIDATVIFSVTTSLDQIDDNINDGVCHTTANVCSLRAAVMQSNHTSTNGQVIINIPAGTYRLTIAPVAGNDESSGDLNLTASASTNQKTLIKGVAASTTIIDGNQLDGVMSVAQNRILEIRDATIRNGFRQGSAPTSGGGVDNRGTLTMTRCVIEANRANPGTGAGLVNLNTLTLIGTTVRSNVGTFGAGLLSYGPTIIHDSTFYANAAATGGAIANNSTLYAVNTTISFNSANLNGGGLFNNGNVILYNTSVVDNDADHDHDENGGIGGGIYNAAGASFGLVNTLVTGNTQRDTFEADDCFGTITAYGWNLFGNVSDCSIPNGAAWGFLARSSLGPLQDNGGPTLTHALLPGSRAIDTTDNDLGCIDETGNALSDDQRGHPRIAGARCDVGAFEYGSIIDRIFVGAFDPL
ncbi:MAG: choice-of-anchor Q domain-containing protein [Tahibacter sp.]